MTNYEQYTSEVEKMVVRALLKEIFSKPGRCVRVNDGEETTGLILNRTGVLKHLATTGSDWIIVYEKGERIGAIWLVWGNGEDLITDYSDNDAMNEIVFCVENELGL